MRLLTSINRASYIGIYALKNKPLDSARIKLDAIKAVELVEINSCAKKYFNTDNLIVVIEE
jgi:predicted Zn-dependent peptidase